MEGVVNARMRALLCGVGGIDRCVTEFVRVSATLLPVRVFDRLCPELIDSGRTSNDVPVFLQLLGSDPALMAENAARAAELGAPGIDTNFGCPAKTVNRHRGGSILLNEPDLVHSILSAMRAAIPGNIPLHAKIRLGYECDSQLQEIVDAVAQSGAAELVVHARTKADGYMPPAHWHRVAAAAAKVKIPLVINGEIWSEQDALQARLDSGCQHIMLGRGLLARPDLARCIRAADQGQSPQPIEWPEMFELLSAFFDDCKLSCPPRHLGGPLKQWLGYLRRHYPEAADLQQRVKRLKSPAELDAALNLERRRLTLAIAA